MAAQSGSGEHHNLGGCQVEKRKEKEKDGGGGGGGGANFQLRA